jgi:hypothetical protein
MQDLSNINLEFIAGEPTTQTPVSDSIRYKNQHWTWPPNDNINQMRYSRNVTSHINKYSLGRIAYYAISVLTLGFPQNFKLAQHYVRKDAEYRAKIRGESKYRLKITATTAATFIHSTGLISLYALVLKRILT